MRVLVKDVRLCKSEQNLASSQGGLKSSLIAMSPVLFREKPLFLVAGNLTAVNHIVLEHENGVKKQAAVAEQKLYGVACYATPVMLEVAVDTKLRQAQDASNHVEEDLPNAPAARALVTVVGEDLGRKLDQRHQEFDVARGIDNVQLAPIGRGIPRWSRPDDDTADQDAQRAAGNDARDEAARASAGAGFEAPERAEEILRGGDEAEDEGVRRKDDVVEGDGRGQAVVAGGILAAHEGGVVEGGVGDEVCGET